MKKKLFYILLSVIFIIGIAVRIFVFKTNFYNVVVDECHSLASISTHSFKEIFLIYEQGANFLPAYKLVLKIITSIFGYNFPILKSLSLICGILSLFLFYKILSKLFNNKIIIHSALILFIFNYTLNFYISFIKNYEIDVLITMILINSTLNIYINFKESKIPWKNMFIYIITSIIFIYTSIPAIVIIESFWLILLFIWIYKKNISNIKRALIFQLLTLPFLIAEYFMYINQMVADTSLKAQWTNGNFFFAPTSLKAVNSLINFSFFHFYWFDIDLENSFPNTVIILFIIVFIAGSLKFILPAIKKEKDFSGIFVVLPVYIFLSLSFLSIYPFCNRLITFLIPVFIIIILNFFDLKGKAGILGNTIVIILLSTFLYLTYTYNELYNLINNTSIQNLNKDIIDNLESNDTHKIIVSLEQTCLRCTNNNNVLIIDPFKIDTQNPSSQFIIYDRRTNETYSDSIKNIINGYDTIYLAYRESDNYNKELELVKKYILKENYKIIKNKNGGYFSEYYILKK